MSGARDEIEADEMRSRVDAAVALLDEASLHHDADVFALFSGGDDSLTNTLITVRAQRFRACVHLDTGIGIPETQAFVLDTCRREGWPLLIYRAKECGQDYESLALAHGFPGPALHYKMYARLKERPLRGFIRAQKQHRYQRLVLSTGARSDESARRMGHVRPVRREGVKVWVNPLHDWTKLQCMDYLGARGVPRNPVVELLHMSGECLCGAFAKPGELREIALWYPAVAERIRGLEARVREAGIAACRWGERPPGRKGKGRRDSAGRVSELCQRCQFRLFDDGEAS